MAETDPPPGLRSDECREPTLEDLVKLCRALNEAAANYVVIGGFAITRRLTAFAFPLLRRKRSGA